MSKKELLCKAVLIIYGKHETRYECSKLRWHAGTHMHIDESVGTLMSWTSIEPQERKTKR